MLIHPWDATGGPDERREWVAATDRFGTLAVNNLDPAAAPLLVRPTSPWPTTSCWCISPDRTPSGPPRGRPGGPVRHQRRAGVHPRLLAGPPRYAAPPWRSDQLLHVRAVRLPSRDRRRPGRQGRHPHRPTRRPAAPKDAMPTSRSTTAPTHGCCPASAGSGLRSSAKAKFKYDDKPTEHRTHVADQLEQRRAPADIEAAAQQGRRLTQRGRATLPRRPGMTNGRRCGLVGRAGAEPPRPSAHILDPSRPRTG